MAPTLIAGSANPRLAAAAAAELGVSTCERTLERFPDSELHVRLEETVRGHDVYVLQPTSPPVDKHLIELIFIADACRRAGAARLTAVVPYFGYARQDRRATGREAVGAAVAASMIEAAGFSCVVTVDLHAPEIEGFFKIPLEHLSATALLARAVKPPVDAVVAAPDLGAAKLAERYGAYLRAPVALLHKARLSGSDVVHRGIVGDVRNRTPLIVDDMITTGGTVESAVKGLLDAGCRPEVFVAATHAVFVPPVVTRLAALPIRQLVTTDTVARGSEWPAAAQIVSVAPLIADAIGRLHRGESLEPLLAHA